MNDATSELQLAMNRLSKVKESFAVASTDPVMVQNRAFASLKPVAPRKLVNVLVASALGFIVGLGIAFITEYLRRSPT